MTRIGHAAPYFMPLFCSSRPFTVVLTVFLNILLFALMLLTSEFLASEYPDTSVFQPDPQDYFRAAILGLFSPFLYFFIERVLIGLKDRYLVWNLLFSFFINDWFLFFILIALAYPQLQETTTLTLFQAFFNIYYRDESSSSNAKISSEDGRDTLPVWHIIPKQSYIFGISWSLGEFMIVVLSNLSSYKAVQQPLLDELSIPLSAITAGDNTETDQMKKNEHRKYGGNMGNDGGNNGFKTSDAVPKGTDARLFTNANISMATGDSHSTNSNSMLISFPNNPLGTPVDRSSITLSRCVDLRRATSSISSNVYSIEQNQRDYGTLNSTYHQRDMSGVKDTSGSRSGLQSTAGPGSGSGSGSGPGPGPRPRSNTNTSSRPSTNSSMRGTLQRSGITAGSEVDSPVLVMNPNDYSLRLTSAGLDTGSEKLGGGTPFLLRRYGYVWFHTAGTKSATSGSETWAGANKGQGSETSNTSLDGIENTNNRNNNNGAVCTVSTIGQGGVSMQGDIQRGMSGNTTLVGAVSRTRSLKRFVEITSKRALTLRILRMCLIVTCNTMLITGEALILSIYFTYVPGHDNLFTRPVVYFGSRTIKFFIWCVVIPFILLNTLVAAAIYLCSELSDYYVEHNSNPSSLAYINDFNKILYFYRHHRLAPVYGGYNGSAGFTETSLLYPDLQMGQFPSMLLRSPIDGYLNDNFAHDLEWGTYNDSQSRYTRRGRLTRFLAGIFHKWTQIASTNTYILATMFVWSSLVFIVGLTSEIIC